MTATAAGEVPWSVAAISSGLSHIQSGRVKVLAVTTAKRAAFNPAWPTAQEVGAKGVDTSIWTGLFAPKGVPQAIVDKIYTDVAAVLQQPDVQEKFKAGGAAVGGMKPAEFGAKVKQELGRLKEVVQAAKVKAE
jgi:tripartite-type tricarboxylate transporter receptor subunit TctC